MRRLRSSLRWFPGQMAGSIGVLVLASGLAGLHQEGLLMGVGLLLGGWLMHRWALGRWDARTSSD